MKDQLFDLLVQIYILAYLCSQPDKRKCVKTVRSFLADPAFQEWVGDFSEEEIEQTAWLLVKHYSEDFLIDQLVHTLPAAIHTAEKALDALVLEKQLQMQRARVQLLENLQSKFLRTMGFVMEEEKRKLNKLLWQELCLGDDGVHGQGGGEAAPQDQRDHGAHLDPLLVHAGHDDVGQAKQDDDNQ